MQNEEDSKERIFVGAIANGEEAFRMGRWTDQVDSCENENNAFASATMTEKILHGLCKTSLAHSLAPLIQ